MQNEVVQCYKQAIRASSVLDRAWPQVSKFERPRYYLPIIEKFFASSFARADLKAVHEEMVKDSALFKKAIKNVCILFARFRLPLSYSSCCRHFTQIVMYFARTSSSMGVAFSNASSFHQHLTTHVSVPSASPTTASIVPSCTVLSTPSCVSSYPSLTHLLTHW